jgi:myo-inositol-1(or 4)-monophosphatase
MTEPKEFAVKTARQAGQYLRNIFHHQHAIMYKGRINIVTEADHGSENLIIEAIRREFPDDDILTEESPGMDRGRSARWIIDPLDGTTNYAHGFPIFCVSIALEVGGIVQLGVVYQPMLDEMFVAERGGGTFQNGNPLQVSSISGLSASLLATGFPYDIQESEQNNIRYFNTMVVQAQAVRRAGSAALDMAYVAAGRFDGFWELKLMPWDTAAGVLLIQEAGGTVTDIVGRPYHLGGPDVLASNGLIHQQMIDALKAV